MLVTLVAAPLVSWSFCARVQGTFFNILSIFVYTPKNLYKNACKIIHSRHRHRKRAKDDNVPECNYFIFKERACTIPCVEA